MSLYTRSSGPKSSQTLSKPILFPSPRRLPRGTNGIGQPRVVCTSYSKPFKFSWSPRPGQGTADPGTQLKRLGRTPEEAPGQVVEGRLWKIQTVGRGTEAGADDPRIEYRVRKQEPTAPVIAGHCNALSCVDIVTEVNALIAYYNFRCHMDTDTISCAGWKEQSSEAVSPFTQSPASHNSGSFI